VALPGDVELSQCATHGVAQDKVPAEDFAHVRATVEASLGKKLEEVFSWIDEEPLGSASIGQVRRHTQTVA
jgi:predicted unusual protein kinase regulating ubiquinone biosynthesis (AarF/ABC1/UbiB family)